MSNLIGYFYSIFGYCMSFFYGLFAGTHAPYVWAILAFTLVSRILLLPTYIPQQKNQAKQFRIQPKMQKLQQKFGNDRQKLSEEQQNLYQREGFNPMAAGCGPLLISMPLLFGVYGAITKPISYVLHLSKQVTKCIANPAVLSAINSISKSKRSSYYQELIILNQLKTPSSKLYSKVAPFFTGAQVTQIQNFAKSFMLLGMDLTQTPNIKKPSLLWLIPILSGVTSFLTSFYTTRTQKRYNPADSKQNAMSTGCMMAFMPLFSLYICFTVPAGVGFYWVLSNVLALFQTIILSNIYAPPKVAAKNMIGDVINKYAYEKSVMNRKKAD